MNSSIDDLDQNFVLKKAISYSRFLLMINDKKNGVKNAFFY